MKKNYVIPVILMFLIMMFISCEFNFSTANVSDIKICERMEGNLCNTDLPVLSSVTSQIFASCALKNAPSNTEVLFIWKYLEGSPLIIDEVTMNSGDKGTNLDIHSSLSRPYNGWPKGRYAVEILVDGNKENKKVKNFEIQ